jgi:NADH-quinone oxidoreductase subunit N
MYIIIASALLGTLLMIAGAFLKNSKSVQVLGIVAAILLLVAGIFDFNIINQHGDTAYYNNMLLNTSYSAKLNLIIAFGVVTYIFIFYKNIVRIGTYNAEYFALIFYCLCGVFILTLFQNVFMLFLGIEIMSIPQYILAGADKRNLKSNEASLKYFLMGAFSTGFLLMGIALLFGATGTFDINAIAKILTQSNSVLIIMSIGFLLIAFGFKASLAPFHIWTPDVYDGAPTPITPLMASIVKVGVFAAFFKFFHIPLEFKSEQWQIAVIAMILLTLLIGNITAVYQQSVKRMLAYSSIAQAGFMLFAVYSFGLFSNQGLLLYAASYILATMGIFAVLSLVKDYTYEGFNGLAKKNPIAAITGTICLFSLGGIPLTGGFFAKYYMLNTAIQYGMPIWVVIIAVIMAAVSVFYYFKVVRAMYFNEPSSDAHPILEVPHSGFNALLIVNAAAIVLLGILPQIVSRF